MERCPICDAEIRPGSRFCTQCGQRLPEPAAVADPWPEPAAPELNAGWPLPEAVPASLADQRTGAGDAPPETAEPTDGPIWAAPPDLDPAAPAVPAWPAPVGHGEPSGAGPAWVAAEQVESTVTDAPWRPAGVAESIATADAEDTGGEPEPEPDEHAAGAAAVEPELPPTFAALPAHDAAGATEPGTTGRAPIARAADLIDELRALLPLLATPGNQAAIADRLEAAVNADSGRWAGLRAAMEDARANPRDVETVLALSRRVDEVIALIDANDRLAAAAREAVAAIRGDLAGDG